MTIPHIDNPKLTARNPHFKNKYAPLDEVLRVVNEGLKGTDYSFHQSCNEEGQFVTALVKGNEVVRASAFPFVYRDDPQGLGSALTYARRYGLCLLFNLVGEDDDDAEGAMGRSNDSAGGVPAATRRKVIRK